jgi:hypothetical protein
MAFHSASSAQGWQHVPSTEIDDEVEARLSRPHLHVDQGGLDQASTFHVGLYFDAKHLC